jgi:long-chain acyl-CoA synthetase
MSSILQALSNNAIKIPKNIAFVGSRYNSMRPVKLTYAELQQQVQNAATQLSALSPNCIALKAENCLDWVITDLAALSANIPCVPIPTFFSDAQIAHTLAQTHADLFIGDWHASQGDAIGELQQLPMFQRQQTSSPVLLANTIKVTFTSGSTGQPKGVCLSQANLDAVSTSLSNTINVNCQKHLALLPLSTLLENITAVYVPLLLGATSLVFKGDQVGLTGSSQFDGTIFANALATYQPHSLVLTPALLMALIALANSNPELVKSLQFVAVGGASVAAQLMQQAHALGIPAYEGYGLSECGSVVCLNTPTNNLLSTCGQALQHVQIKTSEDGEVMVRGNIALGYLGQAFNCDWLCTGDIGSIDEFGFLTISGRKKNQIISSFGRNISPEWVESEAQTVAPARTIVVVGEGQSQLTALVDGDKETLENIVSALHKLNSKLPDYARIGNLITISNLHSMPDLFTSNGRPIRHLFEQWATHLFKQDKNLPKTITITSISANNS